MSVFPFFSLSKVKDVSTLCSLDFESCESALLGTSCRNADAPGYVAKAIWLAVRLEPEKKKKSPIVQTAMEANLDVLTMFIVKCFAHIKKCSS